MFEYTQGSQNVNGYSIFLPRVASGADLVNTQPPNPYAQSAVALFPINTQIWSGVHGYTYCKAGVSDLNIAAPLQNAKAVHAEQDDDIVVGVAAAIGATEVYLTSTTNLDNSPNNVANDFKGGMFYVNDVDGEGQACEIEANEALSTTDDAKFTLADPLTIALTTSSPLCISSFPIPFPLCSG